MRSFAVAVSVLVVLAVLSYPAHAWGWGHQHDCPDTVNSVPPPSSYKYEPRCNHNSMDMTRAITPEAGLGRPGWSHSRQWKGLKMRAKFVNSCTGDCSKQWQTPRLGVDGWVRRPCTSYAYGSTSAKSRLEGLLNTVVREFDDIVKVRHVSPWILHWFDQTLHQCFFGNESKGVLWSSYDTNVQVLLTTVVPPKGDHWAGVPMWAIPCAWGPSYVNGRPLMIRLNVHELALRMSDAEVKRDMRHHLLHALGIDGSTGASFGAEVSAPLGRTQTIMTNNQVRNPFRNQFGCQNAAGVPMDDELRLKAFYSVAAMFRNNESHLRVDRLRGDGEAQCDLATQALLTTDSGSASCGPKIDATAINDNSRHSHFESRVLGSDLPITSVWGDSLRLFVVQALYNTGFYFDNGGTALPWGNAVSAASPTCDLFRRKCSDPANRATDLFCVPPEAMTNSTTTCSANFQTVRQCGLTFQPASFFAATELQAFKYYGNSQTRSGLSAADDFCPRPIGNVQQCTSSSSKHRCFDHMIVSTGSSPASTGASTCYESRCLFGTSVEFKLPGDSSYTRCPNPDVTEQYTLPEGSGRFVGTIMCPKASDFCEPGVNVMPAEPTWRLAPGTDIEYGLVDTLATREQAKLSCASYGNQAVLAFIPTAAVADRVTEIAGGAEAPPVWIGSENGGWVSTLGHTLPARFTNVNLNTAATACGTLGNSRFVANGDCAAPLRFVCSRPRKASWYASPPPGLSRHGFGEPKLYRPANYLNSLVMWAPALPTGHRVVVTSSGALGLCSTDTAGLNTNGHVAQAVLLGNNDDKRAALRAFAAAAGFELTADTPGYWTDFEFSPGDSASVWWAELVVGGVDRETTQRTCYLLGRPDPKDTSRVLYPIECDRSFPVVCIMRNVLTTGRRSTWFQTSFAAVAFPTTLADAEAACTSLGNGHTLSPIATEYEMAIMRYHTVVRAGTANHYNGATASWFGGKYEDGVFNFPSLGPDPTAARVAQYLPKSGRDAYTNGAQLEWNPRPAVSAAAAGVRRPALCSRLEGTAPNGPCGNGTWCWDMRSDHRVMIIEDPVAGEDAATVCAREGGQPAFEAPLPARIDDVIGAQFGVGSQALIAFNTGMKVVGGKLVSVNSSVEITDFGLEATSAFPRGPPAEGDCIWGSKVSWRNDGRVELHGMDCRRKAPVVCKKSISTKFVPYKNESITPDTKWDFEFTMSAGVLTYAEALQTCNSSDGTLAFFRYNQAAGKFRTFDVFPQLEALAGDFWFGLQDPFDASFAFRTPYWLDALYQRDLHGSYAKSSSPPPSLKCYTISPSGYEEGVHTERPCGSSTEKHRALCIRSRNQATYQIPENVYAGPGYIVDSNNKLRFNVPEGNSPSPGANIQVRATTNFTNMTVALSNLAQSSESTITAACANITAATVASFSFEIVESRASVRSEVMQRKAGTPAVTTVWPCIRPVTEQPTAPVRGLVAGSKVNVTFRMDGLLKPGSFADVNLNPSSGLTCSESSLRFQRPSSPSGSEHRHTVECHSATAGVVHTMAPTYAGCSPAQLCKSPDPAFAVPNMRFLFADAAEVSVAVTGSLLSGSEYTGSLKLKHSNSVAYKLTMGVPANLNVNQTEWESVADTNAVPFTVSTAGDGTYPLNVTLALADGHDATVAEEQRFLQYATFSLGSLTFVPTFPVSVSMWTAFEDAAGTTRLYAGQRFQVNFTVMGAAFERDENTVLEVGIDGDAMLFAPFNGSALTTTIRKTDPCCVYVLDLVALPNVTHLLASPPAGFTAGEALLKRLTFRPTSGTYAPVLPLPSLAPLLELHAVKTATLASTVERVFAGGPSAEVILSLPQTPADQTARVTLTCDSTHVQVTPAFVEWQPQEWAAFSARRAFTLASPATSNFHLSKEINVRCAFTLVAGADVALGHADMNLFVAPQAKITYLNPLPTSVLPGTNFNLQLRIAESAYARQLPDTAPKVTNAAVSIVPHPSIGQQYIDGGRAVMRTFLVSVPSTTTSGGALSDGAMCVTFNVSDKTHYETPTQGCFAILPRITVDLRFPSGALRKSQPVGRTSGQVIEVGLSSTPIGTQGITVGLDCIRTQFSGAVGPNVTIATFEAPTLTFTPISLADAQQSGGIGRVPPRQTATLFGVVSEQLCQIAYRVVVPNGATGNLQVVGSTSDLTPLVTETILFADLLHVTYRAVGVRDALYVGDATKGSLVVRIPQAPTSPMTIRCVLTNDQDSSGTAVVVSPTALNVTSSSAGVTEETFVLTALRPRIDDKPVSYALVLDTEAGEYSRVIADATASFDVRAPIGVVVRDSLGLIVGDSVSMYCGGEATAVVLTIELPYAPVNLQSPVQLGFTSNSTALGVSPSRQHFGTQAWSASGTRKATFSLACSDTVKNASVAVWNIVVTAPAEFQPRRQIMVYQRPLVSYTIDSLFREIPVGAMLAFNVRPNLLPPTGTTLKLRFTTSCGRSIAIFDNGLGFSIEWSENAATRTIPLIATAAFENCEIGLVVDDASTAHIFQYTALQHTVTITDKPRVLPVVGRAPRSVVSDDLADGVDFAFTVANAALDPAKAGTVASMATASTSTACVLVQASGDVNDETSVAFTYGLQRNSITARVSEDDSELLIRVSMSIVGKVSSEDLTFTFTSNCFVTTAQAPTAVDPNPLFRNFTVSVTPPPEPLGVANEVVAGTALGLSAFSASPSMGSSVAKLSFVQQECELDNIEAQSNRELSFSEHPIGLPVGPTSDMGNTLGAAIYDSAILCGIFALHTFASFFLYVLRRDFAVEDKTFLMAAGILRFPGATTIAVMYFVPLITQFSLSVAVNANDMTMRATGGLIFAVVCGLGGLTIAALMKKHASEATYTEDKPIEDLPWYKQLYRIRGKWRAPSVRNRLAFSYLYDDFISQVRYYNIAELTITVALGVVSSVKPEYIRTCVIKSGMIFALFAINFLCIVVTRPFRRHVANIFFALITLSLTVASAVTLGAITGRSNSTARWAADVAVQVVGNLIVMKLLFDLGVWAYEVFLRKHVNRMRKDEVLVKFKVSEEPMYVEDLFPHTRKEGQEWDEANDDLADLDQGLLTRNNHKKTAASPEAEALQARQADERRRAQEIMDAI